VVVIVIVVIMIVSITVGQVSRSIDDSAGPDIANGDPEPRSAIGQGSKVVVLSPQLPAVNANNQVTSLETQSRRNRSGDDLVNVHSFAHVEVPADA
jgi:hypothetical protein